ncbi:alpha/beta hydrolase [Roseomonas sp. OT10]|uniref:alpha/beta fold hydrolase n=1 Tax=Roseomonas cutis TaxID=2897332 RepID=UPI001E60C9B9|nr:alpha/beta fold hydrolase [Roseomonas sp. OT10]UFN47632.1 alpha/beta hydrolase [Roseomonas sp. OT10]
MRARVRDTEIWFDVEGMGLVPEGPAMVERPVAFAIHGGPGGDHSGFKPGYTPLSHHMQLVYFDHRGQGRSARGDPQRYTLDENVEDMEALRRHLGLGPIVSLGTSYGGMVAMAHAARYPEAVSHLVLIVTAAHGGFIPRAEAFVRQHGTPGQQRVCERLWAGGFETVEQMRDYYAAMGPLYSRRYDPVAGEASRARARYAPEPLNRAFGPGGVLRGFDLRPELGKITAPTLILAGRHDWICPPDFSEEIHRLIPGSTLRIFEESSHSIRADEPEALMAAITGFVRAPTQG